VGTNEGSKDGIVDGIDEGVNEGILDGSCSTKGAEVSGAPEISIGEFTGLKVGPKGITDGSLNGTKDGGTLDEARGTVVGLAVRNTGNDDGSLNGTDDCGTLEVEIGTNDGLEFGVDEAKLMGEGSSLILSSVEAFGGGSGDCVSNPSGSTRTVTASTTSPVNASSVFIYICFGPSASSTVAVATPKGLENSISETGIFSVKFLYSIASTRFRALSGKSL
jgi:hypothetical protein